MLFIKLDELEQKEPFPGCRMRFVHSENMTLAYWHITPGEPVPAHSHHHEQVVNVIEGKFEMTVGEKTRILESGSVVVIPPDVIHGGKALTDCRIIDVFYPVREDFRYTDD